MEELISVIIPVYQVEKYLKKCVDSVLNQTYTNLEIILVDDGSKDECPKMCDEYAKKDSRIFVIHKENGGLSDARNAGIDIAKGKYITFIDSDDYVDETYIEVLYNAMAQDNSDMAIGSHRAIYETGRILENKAGDRCILEQKEVLYRLAYDEGIDVSAWAKLYKTELFKEIRYPKGRLFEDAAVTYKLIALCNRISVIPDITYNYIIRKESITSKEFKPSKMDLITSTEEMCTFIKNKYPDLERGTDRRLMYAYLSTLSQLTMSSEKFPTEQRKLMNYIKKNGGKILKDKKVPKRDKLGIICAKLGFGFYKFTWNLYRIKTGRK